MFPLTSSIDFSVAAFLVAAFALGLAFGFVLQRAGFGSGRKLTAVFYGYDMAVVKVMFTAIVTAMAGLWLASAAGLLDMAEVYVVPTNYAAQIVGGLLGPGGSTMRSPPRVSALGLNPDRIVAHYNVGVALLLAGEPVAALAEMEQETADDWRSFGLAMAYHALGRKVESDAALAELIRKHATTAAYTIAIALAYRGEADRAFEWLDKAVQYHDSGLGSLAVYPLFTNLHSDPRWLPFLRMVGIAPEQLAAIRFDVMLPE